ncbi:MAG: amidohydrolase family protein [Lachnospiraceae bacterium]|nr:amidohydrolase family protein [Lachnospiraceae bacterium]
MDILVKDFHPVNMLKVEEHPTPRAKYPVIDMHTHWGPILLGQNYASLYETGQVIEKLKKYNITKVLNPDRLWGEGLEKMRKKLEGYEDFVMTLPSVDYARMDDPDFPEYVDRTYKMYKEQGVKAIKLWKDMTLMLRDKNGKFVRLDDERYDPLFACAGKYGLPVLIHVGDPHALFTPIDGSNEYYFILKDHTEWSYLGEEYFTFDQHMEMQENVIARHPETTFVVAHIGSCGENLAIVDAMMEKYPNMYIDIAARLSEIGRQPYTARKFFLKYPDRIMFGTDYEADYDPEIFYPPYFRFLETFDEYFDYMGAPHDKDYGVWKIYGIGLPDDILENIYNRTAKKVFSL